MEIKESLEELYKLQKIKRLESEIVCWKIHILESINNDDKLEIKDLKIYENAIKSNEKTLTKVKVQEE